DGLSSIDTSSFRSEVTGGSSRLSNRSLDAADPNRDGAHPVFVPVEVQSGLDYRTQLSTGSEMTDRSGLTEASERRSDLEEAIKAGDWKSVGKTAALIAGNTDPYRDMDGDSGEFNASTFEDEDLNASSVSVSTTEHSQLREMEQLVEAGDWQAVMQVASRYETATASDAESLAGPDGESDGDSSREEGSRSPELSLQDASAASAAGSQSEYRAEIEDLLSKVMPDELENVDEMLQQFRGREDELLDTLRTMRDRKESGSESDSGGSPPSSGSYEIPPSPGDVTQSMKTRVSIYEESMEGSMRGEEDSIATGSYRRQSDMELSDPLLEMSDPGDPP
ncbi:hypothetical protein THAOC_36569, partial [Thalassiosira oceanica]